MRYFLVPADDGVKDISWQQVIRRVLTAGLLLSALRMSGGSSAHPF